MPDKVIAIHGSIDGGQAIVEVETRKVGDKEVPMVRVVELSGKGDLSDLVSAGKVYNFTPYHNWRQPTSHEAEQVLLLFRKLIAEGTHFKPQ